jgi:DNA-binding MarR family transcriptional regulator
MHAVTFEFKRAHWKSVAFGKEVVKDIDGMTPARFDFLHAIRMSATNIHPSVRSRWARQKRVRELLGLHPMTISRMAIRLEELGWIERVTDDDDERYRILQLTDAGHQAILAAEKVVFGSRKHAQFFEGFFTGWLPNKTPRECIWFHWEMTSAIAEEFGDTAKLFYDFGYVAPDPDDEPLSPEREARFQRIMAESREEARKRLYGGGEEDDPWLN